MARLVLFTALLAHGLIHVAGFVKAFFPDKLPEISLNVSRYGGWAWLSATLLFMVAAFLSLFNRSSWWWIAAAGVILSQILIILVWKDARYGTIPNVIFFFIILIQFAAFQFQEQTMLLERSMQPKANLRFLHVVSEKDLKELPAPVSRWLTHSGVIGKHVPHAVQIRQRGSMLLNRKSTHWLETRSDQYFNVDEPAFLWSVRLNMAGFIPVRGRDLFRNGEGRMEIRLLSLFPMVDQHDEKISEASLQRFLSEIAWFPSAALSPYIHWSPVDQFSALATMEYKQVKGEVLFRFSSEGRIVTCSAQRYQSGGVSGRRERWEVRNLAFGIRNRIEIPLKSEVTWKLADGDFTWYRVEITDISYAADGELPDLHLF